MNCNTQYCHCSFCPHFCIDLKEYQQKNTAGIFFLEIDRPKFIKNAKDALEPKQLLYKTKKCRGSTKFDFITYCKFAILKTVGN